MISFSINGNTRLYGIVGNPVNHSFSPNMQTLAFQYRGLNSVYLPFHIEEKSLPKLLNSFEIAGVKGFNVTVPFKNKIARYLDDLTEEAKTLESVNTVVWESGSWKGYSTDGTGFLRSLKQAGISPRGKSILLLGAGGAARAVGYSLIKEKIASLHVMNRTKENALTLLSQIIPSASELEVDLNPAPGTQYDLLINCTSVGMTDSNCPIQEEYIVNSHHVIDIIYSPSQTPLLKLASQKKIPTQNGIEMLLFQGAEAFEIFTGVKAPIRIMRRALFESLEQVAP